MRKSNEAQFRRCVGSDVRALHYTFRFVAGCATLFGLLSACASKKIAHEIYDRQLRSLELSTAFDEIIAKASLRLARKPFQLKFSTLSRSIKSFSSAVPRLVDGSIRAKASNVFRLSDGSGSRGELVTSQSPGRSLISESWFGVSLFARRRRQLFQHHSR